MTYGEQQRHRPSGGTRMMHSGNWIRVSVAGVEGKGRVAGSETTVVGWMLCPVCSEERVSDSGDQSAFSWSWQCRYVNSVAILWTPETTMRKLKFHQGNSLHMSPRVCQKTPVTAGERQGLRDGFDCGRCAPGLHMCASSFFIIVCVCLLVCNGKNAGSWILTWN